MKHPNEVDESDKINFDDDDLMNTISNLSPEYLAAQSRALAAQNQAIELRTRLEGLEALLAKTKQNLAEANNKIQMKDEEINKVHEHAQVLNKSLGKLEERFERLKVLRNELHNLRKGLGL